MLEWGTEYLQKKDVPSPRLSIEWLLSNVLGCRRLDLYLKFDKPLTEQELAEFKPLLLRRAKMEPLQYITGSTDFYGLRMEVNPSVLIPRPETEQLVERILTQNGTANGINVLDVGTGSGCIALALKHERPDWNVCGFDKSSPALQTANRNAQALGLDVNFFEHDFFHPKLPENLSGPFDVIVSNPPYIPNSEHHLIGEEVRHFEPGQALFHDDISSVYAALINLSARYLKQGGRLYAEIHERFGGEMLSLFPEGSWITALHQDYNGRDRIICARHIKRME